METSLKLKSDDRQMQLCAKENFVTEGNVALQVRARLNVNTGKPSGTIQLRKKFFPDVLTSVDVGFKMDLESRKVTYNLQAKKTVELSSDGLTCLDLKGGYQYHMVGTGTSQQGAPEPRARVEVSQKIFNFTEDQDLKVKLGYDVIEKRPYAQLRENNWTFNAELRNSGKDFAWNVAYDL